MNRNIVLLTLLLGIAVKGNAQNVTVEAKIDSLQILIGEQAKIALEVAMDSKQHAVFPQFGDSLIRGIEVLDTSKPDTQFLNNRQRLLIKQEYTITSFDSALYYIPPLSVQVDNKEYKSRALALKVYSVPVDTLNPDHFFGQKTVMKPGFVWADWQWVILLSVLLIPLAVLLVYFVIRLRDNKPIIRRIKVEPKLPPHVVAIQEIERVKSEKKGEKGEPKEYYTELTDILRTYINERFGFNAKEMTSSEIIGRLMDINEKEDINDLKFLFQTADLVKFAKHNPMINENDANLINAIDFINETKVAEEPNQKPQPTEITVVEKRSLRAKILLVGGIVFISVAVAASLVYIINELFGLIM